MDRPFGFVFPEVLLGRHGVDMMGDDIHLVRLKGGDTFATHSEAFKRCKNDFYVLFAVVAGFEDCINNVVARVNGVAFNLSDNGATETALPSADVLV